MAYRLCSSPSSLLHDPHHLVTSQPSSPAYPFTFNFSFIPRRPRTSLHTRLVSVRETQNSQTSDSDSSSKPYIWVNPSSPRASRLRQKSYDARYDSLLKLAQSLNSCNPVEEDVFSALREGLGDNFLEQDAVVVINNMTHPENASIALKFFQSKLKFSKEVILYNVTMKVFRKCKDLDRAEKLFEEMLQRGVTPDNVTFSTIISCARLCSLPQKAVEWFERMPEFGCNPDDVTYSAMIDAYGRAGNVPMALSLYDRARTERWRIDPTTFSTLIRIYGMQGNYDGCLNVYEEMKAVGGKPNLVIYNTLLDAMGRAKRPWQAKIIFKDLIDNGFTPNRVTYAALLRAYSRGRYGEDAMLVYREMKEKGLEMNVVLYNTVLAMCADLGHVEEAVEIFNDLKNSWNCKPDSWTFSSLVTIFSCSGKVSEAEAMLNEMLEAGWQPNIFVLTSLIQCYGKAGRTDDIVKTFNRLSELDIVPDERFCGCLLNVLTQTPKEELIKVVDCIEKANTKLGFVVKLLVEEHQGDVDFKNEALELFDTVSDGVRRAYCNCLIDLCVNLNLLERACELLDLGFSLEIYAHIQPRSPTQWSLHLKGLSIGAALTAFHVWINDLSRALESGEEFPPLFGINTGHGKHKYAEKGLASVLESHMKVIDAPFHEAPDKVGWFLTTKDALKPWLLSRSSPESVAA